MNIEKLVQVVSYLLKKYEHRLNYTKLIKILYLADKASFGKINHSITGDTYVSMQNGPVLSELYSLICGKSLNREHQCYWDARFSKDSYDLVSLSERIPEGKLSRFEKKILDSIDEEFHNAPYGALIEHVHNPSICPEWKDTGSTSTVISIQDILVSLGRTKKEIDFILEEERLYSEEDKILESLSVL